MSQLRVNLFENGRSEFLSLLREHDIEFLERAPRPGAIMNAGEVIEIINAVKDASPYGAVALVLITWLRGRASRKVIVQADEKTIVHIEGYSVTQVEKLLEKAISVTAIQTEKDDA
jgi:hypothetical protein